MKHDNTKSTTRFKMPIPAGGDSEDRDPLEALAAEYAERYRNGERVTVEEYAARFPELADEVRDLLPTVAAMERLQRKRSLETATAASDTHPAQLGDYRVIGEIARGGMGIVYEAEQITLGRRVAVKVLPQHALRRERDVRRFEREAQTAANLHHSNIVPVFGVGEDDGHHYIVMQLIRGVGLDEILDETKRILASGPEEGTAAVTTARSNTIQRSAIGLLEEDLRRDTTVVSFGDDTLLSSDDHESTKQVRPPDSPPPSPRQIRAVIGAKYYRNVAKIGQQAAQALHYAHQHDTLHRDVKPGNLLLDEEGMVWMADFGLAKAVDHDQSVTGSGDVVGTLGYVAPERFRGETTARSDIYSLGLTLHEMLTFQRAFDGKDRVAIVNQVANERLTSPRKLNPAVPRDLETIVLKAASHDPTDRYETAGELARDLEAFLEDRPIQARRLSHIEHSVRWCRRNRLLATLAASVVFLLATVFGVTVVGYFHADRQRQRAEEMSRLAVNVLDELYTQFTSHQLNVPTASGADANEEQLLLGSSQLPLSKDVALLLENLLKFYDDLSNQSGGSQIVAVKSIAANRRVGDIRRRMSQLDEARSTYERAIERIDRLDPWVRDTEAVRLESARIHNGLGIVLQEGRNTKDSIQAYQNAIATLDHPAATENERFELARSLYLLHDVQKRSRRGRRAKDEPPNDCRELKRAKLILSALEARHPELLDYRFLLARCLLADESGCAKDGELNPSQHEAIAILETLVRQAPDNADYQFELGEAYRAIEWNEFWENRHSQRLPDQLQNSEARLRRALEVTANLATQHPNIPQYNVLQKGLHQLLAIALQQQDKLTAAADEYVRAIEKQRLVVQQSEGPPHRHQVWLCHLELSYSQLLRDLGRYQQARDLLEATAGSLEELVELPEIRNHDFSRRIAERTLSRCYLTLANVLESLGVAGRAEELLQKAEAVGS